MFELFCGFSIWYLTTICGPFVDQTLPLRLHRGFCSMIILEKVINSVSIPEPISSQRRDCTVPSFKCRWQCVLPSPRNKGSSGGDPPWTKLSQDSLQLFFKEVKLQSTTQLTLHVLKHQEIVKLSHLSYCGADITVGWGAVGCNCVNSMSQCVSLDNPYLLLYVLFRLIIQDWSEAMLGHCSLRIQTEVEADMNGREFIPKLVFTLQQRGQTDVNDTNIVSTDWYTSGL